MLLDLNPVMSIIANVPAAIASTVNILGRSSFYFNPDNIRRLLPAAPSVVCPISTTPAGQRCSRKALDFLLTQGMF